MIDELFLGCEPDPLSFFWSTPVAELDGPVNCASCGAEIPDYANYDGAVGYFCDRCATERARRWFAEACAYAEKEVRINRELPPYDPASEFRCTPEEYNMGARESYTPNSYLAHCRHCCTNYDALIAPLDRDNAEHRVYYQVIRTLVDHLLEEHEDYMCPADVEDGPEDWF